MRVLFSLLLAQSFFHDTTHKVAVLPILCIKNFSFEILGTRVKRLCLHAYNSFSSVDFPNSILPTLLGLRSTLVPVGCGWRVKVKSQGALVGNKSRNNRAWVTWGWMWAT